MGIIRNDSHLLSDFNRVFSVCTLVPKGVKCYKHKIVANITNIVWIVDLSNIKSLIIFIHSCKMENLYDTCIERRKFQSFEHLCATKRTTEGTKRAQLFFATSICAPSLVMVAGGEWCLRCRDVPVSSRLRLCTRSRLETGRPRRPPRHSTTGDDEHGKKCKRTKRVRTL